MCENNLRAGYLDLERLSSTLVSIIVVSLLSPLSFANLIYAQSSLEVFIDGPDMVNSDDYVTLTGGYSQSTTNDMTNTTMSSTSTSIAYEWTYLSDLEIDYSPDNDVLTFTAPPVDSETQLTFELIVTSDAATGSTSKSITVMPGVIPPIQEPVPNVIPPIQEPVPNVIPPIQEPVPNVIPPIKLPDLGNVIPPIKLPDLGNVIPPIKLPDLGNVIAIPFVEGISPLPLNLIVIAGIAVVIIAIAVAVSISRRNRDTDAPLISNDRNNQRTSKNTVEIVTEGGIE